MWKVRGRWGGGEGGNKENGRQKKDKGNERHRLSAKGNTNTTDIHAPKQKVGAVKVQGSLIGNNPLQSQNTPCCGTDSTNSWSYQKVSFNRRKR